MRQQSGTVRLAQEIVSKNDTVGGHGSMAGGQIQLGGREPDLLAQQASEAVKAYFKISAEETRRKFL